MSDPFITPETFTADYVGTPGHRTFYLQARAGADTHTYLVEKQQVAVLADKLRELLLMIDRADTVSSTQPSRDPALAIATPVAAEARVGTIGLGFEEDNDAVVVFLQPVTEEPEDLEADDVDEDEDVAGDFGVRFRLRRDQARAFVLHSLAVVAEGRPTCRLCGLPMDPEGHRCPASNGHRLGS